MSEKMLDASFGQLKKAIIITDPDVEITYVNKYFEKITGYTREEVMGKNPGSFLQGQDTDPAAVALMSERLAANEPVNVEIVNYKKDGTPFWIELDIVPETDSEGNVIRFISIQTDITTRVNAEKELLASEEKYKLLSNASNELICMHDPSGNYVYITPSVENILGYSQQELLGQNPYDYFHPADLSDIEQSHHNALGGAPQHEIEYRYRRKDGSYIWLSTFTDIKLDDEGEVEALVTRSRDITDRKNAEEELRLRERQLRSIANSIPGLIVKFSVNDGRAAIHFISDGCKEIFGHSPREIQNNPRLIRECLNEGDTEKALRAISASSSKLEKLDFEFQVKEKQKWYQAIGLPIKEENGQIIWDAVIIDITASKIAQKALEKSEERFKKLSGLAVDYAYSVTVDGEKITNEWTFGAFQQITGYSSEELQEIGGYNKLIHQEDMGIAKRRLDKLLKGHASTEEFRIITKDRQVRWIRDIAVPEWDPDLMSPSRILGLAHDITQLKIAESENQDLIQSLKRALDEKDDLFRELHHRIKNNLQLVSSLLYLKSSSTVNEDLKDFIKETNLRITSISKIHEQLLKMQNVNTLNVKEYIYDLSQNLISAYSDSSASFYIDYDLEDLTMDIDKVLTVGLILNEAVSNTIKYAYPNKEEGRIQISFLLKKGECQFIVADDGIGFDLKNNSTKEDSLGYQLITLFTKQIEGKMKLTTDKGTRYEITFPYFR
jgi:PAS domain S-box-containing protein